MIDRRFFLKVTGFVVAASALDVVPVAAQAQVDRSPTTPPGAAEPPAGVVEPLAGVAEPLAEAAVADGMVHAPGWYRLSGRVQLSDSRALISGIANEQQISWSPGEGASTPVVGFTAFEYFDTPWRTPPIRVRGGQLDSLEVVPFELA